MKPHRVLLAVLVCCTFVSASALAQANRVVEENRKAGTTDWLLHDYKNVVKWTADKEWKRDKSIEAYCSAATIRAGQKLTIYVSTDPAAPFKIDFYRMGYYGGTGGRRVLATDTIQGKPQPTPTDGEKALIECKWSPGYELTIPGDWLSGVYLGKLSVAEPKAESYVIFVVRDDRRCDLLFQVSDLTWQSYNRWPGNRSLYDFGEKTWHGDPGNDVGFDRPYGIYANGLPSDWQPISKGSGEFLLWEFPLAFWLEKEGYDVSYISNIDTHADREGLLRAKGFLSVGHDEYWTQQLYDNVAYARDQGVSLAFLSGNSVSGIVYLNPSTDGRPNRVFGRIKRFGEAAQELMGSRSYGVGRADWVCRMPEHWIFAGTGMKRGDGIKELVGWEYHGSPNGNQPGLTVVAGSPLLPRQRAGQPAPETPPPSPPPDELPPRSHTSTVYETPKGNIVFDAGTCFWSLLLSEPPGSFNPPHKDFSQDDPRVQQITKNVLARMIRGRP